MGAETVTVQGSLFEHRRASLWPFQLVSGDNFVVSTDISTKNTTGL